ncbi:MAG: ATP-dependent helicase, partial [Parcubacteria group bacterium]
MSLISESNSAQQKAIQHLDGPQLIVAGAGTGKTRVITARIAWLITEKNVNTDEVLALTFTDKAAGEMSDRVETMLPYGYVDLWILTFHSFCDKVLKRHALDIGLPDDYKLLDETEAWLLIRKNLDRFNLDYYQPLGNPTKFIHALIKHFSRCKDEGIGPDAYLKYAEDLKLNNDATTLVKDLDIGEMSADEIKELKKQEILRINEIANAYHVYQQILLENSCLDFGDLICYTIQLFNKRPAILEKYRRQFKHILVDEFQDTNYVQYELIKLLAAPRNNLTVVGDDNQSIYKFRGAAITNILQFKKDFPKAEEVVLTDNYRSCQEILDLAYKSISQNTASLEKELGIDKRLKSHSEKKCTVDFTNYATGDDEASGAIDEIVSIKEAGKCDWSGFAILTRANDSANTFVAELERRKIPYQFLAMRGLYNKPIIVDVLSYFKLLDNYHEAAAAYRALNFKWLGLDHHDVIRLVSYANKKTASLYETMKNAVAIPGLSKETLSALNTFFVQLEKFGRDAKTKKPSEVFVRFLYDSGALNYLEKQNNQASRDDMSYLQQFLKKVQAFETAEPDPRVADLLELIKMEMEAGDDGRLSFDAETGPDLVKVMTIHGSKGLEFEYVFLPCLVDRKFPTDERHEAIAIPDKLIRENIPVGDFHLEEERRLFYVAMTRARRGLFFSSADNYGGTRDKKISRFLVELGYAKPETTAGSMQVQTHDVVHGFADKPAPLYELPTHFSFSQMQNYEKCPLK